MLPFMPEPPDTQFSCPGCGAAYTVVRMHAAPVTQEEEIACVICGETLVGRDGRFVLKYFLTDPPTEALSP